MSRKVVHIWTYKGQQRHAYFDEQHKHLVFCKKKDIPIVCNTVGSSIDRQVVANKQDVVGYELQPA